MRILLVILLSGFLNHAFPQCFSSPGNPVGGTANIGILDAHLLRIIAYYRYNYSDQYYKGDKKHFEYAPIKSAFYNYIGQIISYGISKRINIETEFGYYIDKTEEINLTPSFTISGKGFSNATASAKLNILKNNLKRFEWTMGFGGKLNFYNKARQHNNVELPLALQPSTGAFGTVVQSYLIKEYPLKGYRFFLANRYEYNFKSIEGFYAFNQRIIFGQIFLTSVFISKRLHFRNKWLGDNWTAIVQIRNEIRTKSKIGDLYVETSGSNIYNITPQLNYTLKKKWNLSVLVDIPFYKYYNSIQLANKYAYAFNLTRDIPLAKDIYYEDN